MANTITRRAFFNHTAVYAGAAFLAMNFPRTLRAAKESDTPAVLSQSEWATVEAITGRIIPTDSDPGAIEAGCVNFIDKALANEDQLLRPEYEAGLRGLDAASQKRFRKSFITLDPQQQDEVLAAMESGSAEGWPKGDLASEQFFETVRTHSVLGFLAKPEYGGNRDYAGWKLMGYPWPRHAEGGYTIAQTQGDADVVTVWGGKLPR